MKIRNLNLAALVLVLSLSFASAAQAHDRHIARSADTITSSSARTEGGYDNSGFSLGMSSYSGLTLAGGVGAPSFAALLSLGKGHHLQINFTIPATNPAFQLAGGAIYKYFFMEHGAYGFHVGGGGIFGTNGGFIMTAGGLAGFHFPFPGTNNQLNFHFDGGPVVNVAGGAASFALAPLSALLGMSVFYTF